MVKVGSNQYLGERLSDISDDIFQGVKRDYFLVFEEDATLEQIEKAFLFFDKDVIIEVFNQDFYKKRSHAKISKNEVLFFREIKVAYTKLTKNQLEKLRKADLEFKLTGNRYVLLIKYPKIQIESFRDNKNWAINSFNLNEMGDGEGVKVAILDSGIQKNHEQFSSRKNLILHDFTGSDIDDIDGHGTFCAGLLAGSTDSEGNRIGIAPKCKLFVGKVRTGSHGTTATMLLGIFWAILNKCRVISISMEEENDDNKLVYERTIDFAKSNQVFVVTPTGNGSERPNFQKNISTPGRCKNAITIGGITENGYGYEIYKHSNQAQSPETKIDFVGPAENVYSSKMSSSFLSSYDTDNGTSMAVPLVAGIIALLIKKHPKKSMDDIIQILIKHTKMEKGWNQKDFGNGRIEFTNT